MDIQKQKDTALQEIVTDASEALIKAGLDDEYVLIYARKDVTLYDLLKDFKGR